MGVSVDDARYFVLAVCFSKASIVVDSIFNFFVEVFSEFSAFVIFFLLYFEYSFE